MKRKFNPQNISAATRSLLLTGTIGLILLFGFSACQSLNNNTQTTDQPRAGVPAGSFWLNIHGSVNTITTDSIDPNSNLYWHTDVVLLRHRYPCSDSTNLNDVMSFPGGGAQGGLVHIGKSGTYHGSILVVPYIYPKGHQIPTCYTAFVASYSPSSGNNSLSVYDTLLAGPIKIGMDSLVQNLPEHYDSSSIYHYNLRIDFVVENSMK